MKNSIESLLYKREKQLLAEHRKQLKSVVTRINLDIKKIELTMKQLDEDYSNKNQFKIDF
ncbi:hypothetical protein [Thiomicrorhabdus sp.]|uniref:hypothetical protein n=1 Tax=Thiomicrorhabdus sp. TaxID=2039724 RepID=UPI0029C6AA43|nr:hypothetical protein [Thiomicrorhabdus sp.]